MSEVTENDLDQQTQGEAPTEAVVDWQAKAQENWDLYLRSRAEMDNLQKRLQKQLEDAHKYAVERFAGELLGIKDSLEMALTADTAQAQDAVQKGVEMTLDMFNQVFERFGLRAVNPQDARFDPNAHQAIAAIDSEGEANRVLLVHQKGYFLNDRLLRPALVSVSKAASVNANEGD